MSPQQLPVVFLPGSSRPVGEFASMWISDAVLMTANGRQVWRNSVVVRAGCAFWSETIS